MASSDPRVEALQAVVDRVVSWQDGATRETVRDELARGVREAGLEVPADLLDELAGMIHAEADRVDAAALVERRGGAIEAG